MAARRGPGHQLAGDAGSNGLLFGNDCRGARPHPARRSGRRNSSPPGIGWAVASSRRARLATDPLHYASSARDRCGPYSTRRRVGSGAPRSGFQWDEEFRDKPFKSFFEGEVEPCINGGALALGAYFGRPTDSLARRLVDEQLEDGGWNCEAPESTRSSFHTTICVLEGLLEYERAVGSAPEIAAARRRGEEYLLKRALFRRLSTGEVANPAFLKFAFPPRYHYDVLRALDYLRDAGVQSDARVGDAMHVVESRRQADGRWLLDDAHDEPLAFPFDESVGEPSRWNTLRALRVLRWLKPTSIP